MLFASSDCNFVILIGSSRFQTAALLIFFVDELASGLITKESKAQRTTQHTVAKMTVERRKNNNMLLVLLVEHRVPPQTPVCYTASSISTLTKHGAGSLVNLVNYPIISLTIDNFPVYHSLLERKTKSRGCDFFDSPCVACIIWLGFINGVNTAKSLVSVDPFRAHYKCFLLNFYSNKSTLWLQQCKIHAEVTPLLRWLTSPALLTNYLFTNVSRRV